MDKILYIHVGTPKTGTSAIQEFCALNKEAFEKRGYCYPILPYRYKNKSSLRNGHFLTGPVYDSNGKRNKAEEKRRYKEGIEIVKNLFQSYDAVVLSDEALWRSTTHWRSELWEELKQMGKEIGFKLVIIVYLRRQDEYLTSLWSQDVKMGFLKKASRMTWEEWYKAKMTDRVIDYGKKMKEYIGIVGRENVIIRKYDRSGFVGGNIFADFLQTIGLALEDDFVIPENERNPSLKGNTNEIRRIINTVPNISDSDHYFLRDALLGYADISAGCYPSSVMSKEEREELLSRCEEGNREVARLIYGEDRELFERDENDLPKWDKNNPYMLDDVIRLIASTTVQLREENRVLQQRVNQLEKELHNATMYSRKNLMRRIKRIVKKDNK